MIIIAVIVQAIHYTMQEGEIFGWLGYLFFKLLPSWLHQPVFDCAICMTFWYGSILYWTYFGSSLPQWLITVIGAMGINVVISKFQHDDTATVSDDVQSSL